MSWFEWCLVGLVALSPIVGLCRPGPVDWDTVSRISRREGDK